MPDEPHLDTDESVRDRLRAVHRRVAAACARAARAPDEITVIGVTKTFPAETVRRGVDAGMTDLGENRVQELTAKSEVVPGAILGGGIRWHLIGPLQRNKAKDAARCADVFHCLDSRRLAETLDRRVEAEERVLPCFVQVNVSGEATKSGVAPKALSELLEGLRVFRHLKVIGLMTLAAPARRRDELETVVRPQFRLLQSLAERHALAGLSMGMSGDFEVAIEEGATHIRVGSAIFGHRGG